MPAANCNDSFPMAFAVDSGTCEVHIEWSWDGVSTPPCQGTIDGVSWVNSSPTKTYYAHLGSTRAGKACRVIGPGDSGNERRNNVLNALGLTACSDLADFMLNDIPPTPDEVVF
jgi:hypothetical protein